MKIYNINDPDLQPIPSAVVSVGSYDGLHRGHRELLRAVIAAAHEIGGHSVVVTFEPHPRGVVEGVPVKLLTTLQEKEMLLEQAGIDYMIIIPFDSAFSRISSREFVTTYLVGRLGAKKIVVGYNHHFGYRQEGNSVSLEEMAAQNGLEVEVIEQKRAAGGKISSTIIRKAVAEGQFAKVKRQLGYNYFMIADLTGAHNIALPFANKQLPGAGTYQVRIEGVGKNELTVTPSEGLLLGSSVSTAIGQRVKIVFSDK